MKADFKRFAYFKQNDFMYASKSDKNSFMPKFYKKFIETEDDF